MNPAEPPPNPCEMPAPAAALPEVLTATEAAELLRVHVNTLARWRRLGTGPAFGVCGQTVRYSRRALLAWAAGETGNPAAPAESPHPVNGLPLVELASVIAPGARAMPCKRAAPAACDDAAELARLSPDGRRLIERARARMAGELPSSGCRWSSGGHGTRTRARRADFSGGGPGSTGR